MKKLLFSVLTLCILLSGAAFAKKTTANEQLAWQTVTTEIEAVLSGESPFAKDRGKYSDFDQELIQVLKKTEGVGRPKTIFIDDKPVKILVPLNLDENRVGGFYQVSVDGATIISYLVWTHKMEPLFIVERKRWESAATANDLEELKELVPIRDDYSPGVPVELSDLTDVYLIDYLELLPSKTQEELDAYTAQADLKSTIGRRKGSSKCLSYSAALASDWWNIVQGRSIGKYDSFVNGAREYGLNPRALESLYFNHPKSPYAFIKATGKDRVTGEKIPYSPKHYAYIMTSIDLPKSIADPIRENLSYGFPANGFAMDLPYANTFEKARGDVEAIKRDLQRFGIMYAQHTSRLFKNRVSNRWHGVHAVTIVGTAKLYGNPVVLYRETFGHNHRDYLEDSFYGPALRAFPVKFFYQGIVFPHRLIPEVKITNSTAVISFKTAAGQSIAPEHIQVMLNGSKVSARASSRVVLPIDTRRENLLEVKFARRYFYTPEEGNGYERKYIISGDNLIELKEYEAVLNALNHRRKGVFKRMFGKSDSYTDYLKERAPDLLDQIKERLNDLGKDRRIVHRIAAEIKTSPILRKSELGRIIASMIRFNNSH